LLLRYTECLNLICSHRDLSPDSRLRLFPAGITTSALKMTRVATSAWWFVTLKVEGSGGRGALNLMPVKGFTVMAASQAPSEHPPPDHTH